MFKGRRAVWDGYLSEREKVKRERDDGGLALTAVIFETISNI